MHGAQLDQASSGERSVEKPNLQLPHIPSIGNTRVEILTAADRWLQGGQKKGPSKLAQVTEQAAEPQGSTQEPWETADTIMLNMLMVRP